MDISIWGPSLWELMHCIAYNYNLTTMTDLKKKHYVIFFNTVGYLIPCAHCREHYIHYVRKHPIEKAVTSYDKICNWVNNLHNSVNSKFNKKIYSLEESRNRYINNGLQINHNIIFNFIENAVNLNRVEYFKRVFISLYQIFPCNECREKLIRMNKTNNLYTTNNIKKWYKNINIQNYK